MSSRTLRSRSSDFKSKKHWLDTGFRDSRRLLNRFASAPSGSLFLLLQPIDRERFLPRRSPLSSDNPRRAKISLASRSSSSSGFGRVNAEAVPVARPPSPPSASKLRPCPFVVPVARRHQDRNHGGNQRANAKDNGNQRGANPAKKGSGTIKMSISSAFSSQRSFVKKI